MRRHVRMPRFLRRAQQLAAERRSTPAGPGFGGVMTPSVSGVSVTPQSALTFSAYYAGVRVITEDLASLPLMMFRREGNGGSELMSDHPVTRFFGRSPDGESNDMNWRETWYQYALGWGTGYASIDWSTDGEATALHLIHPNVIKPKRNPKNGRLYYEISPSGGEPGKVAAPYQILNLAMLGSNGLEGYSIVKLMYEMIATGKAQDNYAGSFFGNGAWPGGVVEFARSMSPEALGNFRSSWNQQHQGSLAAHRVALLEEGAKWVQNSIPPEQAQMVAARMFTVIDMCRVLRLPPTKLADFVNARGQNVEASNEDYVISCLRPMAVRVNKAVDFKLLGDEEWGAGFYTKHDFRPLLLRTAKDEADFFMKMFQIGYYTVDEMKILRRENPIGEAAGGSRRFVQAQLVDILKAGEPPPKGQEPKPPGEPGRPERFQINGFAHENS